ncbi:hypothetical protein F2P56_036484, partial [Juglans regia]
IVYLSNRPSSESHRWTASTADSWLLEFIDKQKAVPQSTRIASDRNRRPLIPSFYSLAVYPRWLTGKLKKITFPTKPRKVLWILILQRNPKGTCMLLLVRFWLP